jgi:hypothetical protein
MLNHTVATLIPLSRSSFSASSDRRQTDQSESHQFLNHSSLITTEIEARSDSELVGVVQSFETRISPHRSTVHSPMNSDSSDMTLSRIFTQTRLDSQTAVDLGGGAVASASWIGFALGSVALLLGVCLMLWCLVFRSRKNRTARDVVLDTDVEIGEESMTGFGSSDDKFGDFLHVDRSWDPLFGKIIGENFEETFF